MRLDTVLLRSGIRPAAAVGLGRSSPARLARRSDSSRTWASRLLLTSAIACISVACSGGWLRAERLDRPPPSLLPVALSAVVSDLVRGPLAASLEDVAAAEQQLARLEDRQQREATAWLIPSNTSREANLAQRQESDPTTYVPLASLIAEQRRRLAAIRSRLLGDLSGGAAAVADAAAARDLWRLRNLADHAADGVTVAHALLASGDVALEGGWQAAASEAWQQAERVAELIEHAPLLSAARDRLQLPMVALPDANDCRHAATSSTRAAPEPAPIDSLLWETPLPTHGRPHPEDSLQLTASLDGTPPLVCWHRATGVHARRLADGDVPWADATRGPMIDRIFPLAGDASTTLSGNLSISHGRLLSIAEVLKRSELFCLEITDAAEGRLLWTAPLPRVSEASAATLACGRSLRGAGLVFVCTHGSITELAAFRLADGKQLWQLPLGLKRTESTGQPTQPPVVSEDLVIVAAGDGSLWAVTHTGEVAWMRTETAASQVSTGPSVLAAGGCVAARSPDGRQITAIDSRTGQPRWQFSAPAAVRLIGLTSNELIASYDNRLVSLSLTDGSLLASRQPAALSPRSSPLLAAGRLFWPTDRQSPPAAAADRDAPLVQSMGSQVRMLCPATLEEVAAPVNVGRLTGDRIRLAADRSRLVVCDGSSLKVFRFTGVD